MRHGVLVLTIIVAGLAVFAMPPVAQGSAYHEMADQRSFLGLPNALNVLSNLPFAFIGFFGLVAVTGDERRQRLLFRDRWVRWPYLALFGGTVLTAAGSAYYHLAPSNARLVWDRLAMAIGFAGLVTAVIAERVSARAGRLLFGPLVVLGIASVASWYWTELAGRGDLRLYALVQFGSLFVVVMILLLYRERDSGTPYLVAGLLAYGVAKVCELADQPIFARGHIVSGHTLKHVAAAGDVACIAAMLRTRGR